MLTHDPLSLDITLVLAGYLIALLGRFRPIIYVLESVVFVLRIWQVFYKDKVQINQHLLTYIHNLRKAEKIVFPVVFAPILKLFHKKNKVIIEAVDTSEKPTKRTIIIPDY